VLHPLPAVDRRLHLRKQVVPEHPRGQQRRLAHADALCRVLCRQQGSDALGGADGRDARGLGGEPLAPEGGQGAVVAVLEGGAEDGGGGVGAALAALAAAGRCRARGGEERVDGGAAVVALGAGVEDELGAGAGLEGGAKGLEQGDCCVCGVSCRLGRGTGARLDFFVFYDAREGGGANKGRAAGRRSAREEPPPPASEAHKLNSSWRWTGRASPCP